MNVAKRLPQSATRDRTALSWLASHRTVALLLFVAALVPRAWGHSAIVTVDEAYHWFDRVVVFMDALRRGDWVATNIIGHPGVTTLWLGAAGALLGDALAGVGVAAPDGSALHRALVRLPVALVTSGSVALGFLLLRRLLDGRVALLAALFWAFDPFLVAHSGLLHLDGLLASFMTLSLLCAVQIAEGSGPRAEVKGQEVGEDARAQHHLVTPSSHHPVTRWWLASGVFGGLALLTKSPAVLLLPIMLLFTIYDLRFSTAENKETKEQRNKGTTASWLRKANLQSPISNLQWLKFFLLWLGVAGAVWVALWPAAWADLWGAVGRVLLQAEADGGSPHGWGNFFLGQPVADPGLLFYPVALALRLTPWALVGVLLLPLALWLGNRGQEPGARSQEPAYGGREAASPHLHTSTPPHPLIIHRRVVLLLTLFVLAFLAMMSVPPKKFDRYILPVFPVVDILAAVGWIGIVHCILHISKWMRKQYPMYTIQFAIFFVLLSANLAWYHPYELAYYNPLLGGGASAARAMPVGWGEGYEQVGAYINAQPDGRDRPVATWFEPVLRPNVATDVVPLTWLQQRPGAAGYAVLYIDQLQRQNRPEAIAQLSQLAPVHTVRIHGIDYAYVYQLPQPAAVEHPADFGNPLHFRGYDLDAASVQTTSVLTLTTHWQARASMDQDYTLFVHVLNEHGELVGQADVPPGGPRAPTSAWQAGHYYSAVHQVPLRATLPKRYWLMIGVYDPQTFARLPLRDAAPPAPGAPNDGADALVLGPFVR